MKLRRIIYGLLTITSIRKLGYFMPYRYASDLDFSPDRYPWLHKWFCCLSEDIFLETLKSFQPYLDDLRQIQFKNPKPSEPRWDQDWFPGLDAVAAYGLVRSQKPKTIIEIGSGHSTRFLLKAVTDENIATQVVCIDPEPRATLKDLEVKSINQPIQLVDLNSLPQLKKDDILFIDSSHLAVANSDVDWIINRLLPDLPPGVLIHFHDIFLPDPYPSSWEWRGYNEQIIVAGLLGGKRFKPVFSSYFMRKYALSSIKETGFGWIEAPSGAIESSLWLLTQ